MNTIKAGGLIYLAFFYVLLLAAKAPVQQNTDTILKKAQAIYLTQPQRAISMIKNACRLAKIKNDNIGQVKSLNKLAVFFWQSRRYDSARVYSRIGLLISEKLHIDSLQAESWMILGITDHSLSGYSAAIEKYEKAVSLYAKDNLSLHLGKAYLNIAICQMQLSAYEKSITTCFLAENYLLKSNDFKDAATTDNTIGSCFFALANYPKGIAYYKKALSTRMRLKENVLIAQSFNNLGDAFMQNNQPDSAIFYLGKSVSLYQREKNLDFLVLPLQNLGDSWKMKGNLNLASDYITRSLYIANELNMREEFARGNLDLAGIYIARKKFAEARAAANVSEKTAKSLKLPELLMNTYAVEANIYEKQGDYKKALAFTTKTNAIRDSLFTLSKDKAINELEIKYQSAQKEKDIAALHVRNNLTQRIVKQQKQFIIILIAAALLLLVLLFVAYRNFMQKNKANQRIQTLMREVHHRIKNNLQMLVGLFNLQIESLGDEAAKQTLRENEARLTSMNLIHNSLYQHHDTNEIEMSAYVKKLLTYIKDSFSTQGVAITVLINVPEIKLEADKAVAIGLIINELATNSLKYAFAGKAGTISLDMHLVNKTSLSLSLADNGKGLPPASANNSTSFGLKLVSLMVKQLGAAITVKSDKGTSYQISIPL